MKNFRIYSTISFLVLFFFLGIRSTKAEVISDESPYIEVSDNITIDSKKVGDVFAVAQEINLENEVDGDFFAIGKKITLNAPITGNARLIAEQIIINAPITGSLMYIADNVYVSSLGEIEKDAYGFTNKLSLDGRIGKNLNLNGSENSSSKIAGKVIGNIYYSGTKPEILEGSFVNGEIIKSFDIQNQESTNRLDLIISKIFHSLTIILVGLILLKFFNKQISLLTKSYRANFAKNMLFGIASFILLPIILIMLFISVIGFPIALFIISGIISVSYFGFIFPAIALGEKIFTNKKLGILHLITGVLILDILTMTPYIGHTISLIIVISSIGLITRKSITNLKSKKQK